MITVFWVPRGLRFKHVTLTKDFRCSSVVTMRCTLPSGVTRTQATVFSIATFQVVRHYESSANSHACSPWTGAVWGCHPALCPHNLQQHPWVGGLSLEMAIGILFMAETYGFAHLWIWIRMRVLRFSPSEWFKIEISEYVAVLTLKI